MRPCPRNGHRGESPLPVGPFRPNGERVRVRGSRKYDPCKTACFNMRSSQPWKSNRSRVLRANASSAEDVLWQHLRNRRLGGFKFVRQAPIAGHFADFLCRDAGLIVEVDGGTHGEAYEIKKDAARSRCLEALGFRLLRVQNCEVYENVDGVLDFILATLEGRGG
jgi:very-short-patch-repair endonuclease